MMSEKKSVLIIDDEKNLRDLLSRILSLENYDVTSFESAEEGLEEIEKKFYHVALIDVLLPRINGIKLEKF